MNSEFGFVVQPLSVFKTMNIEFGCALQPKSGFNNVNIEFGCPAPAPAPAAASMQWRTVLRSTPGWCASRGSRSTGRARPFGRLHRPNASGLAFRLFEGGG